MSCFVIVVIVDINFIHVSLTASAASLDDIKRQGQKSNAHIPVLFSFLFCFRATHSVVPPRQGCTSSVNYAHCRECLVVVNVVFLLVLRCVCSLVQISAKRMCKYEYECMSASKTLVDVTTSLFAWISSHCPLKERKIVAYANNRSVDVKCA